MMGVTSMEDAAALASSAQPTGYTLQTANVHTKVWDPGWCISRLGAACEVDSTLLGLAGAAIGG